MRISTLLRTLALFWFFSLASSTQHRPVSRFNPIRQSTTLLISGLVDICAEDLDTIRNFTIEARNAIPNRLNTINSLIKVNTLFIHAVLDDVALLEKNNVLSGIRVEKVNRELDALSIGLIRGLVTSMNTIRTLLDNTDKKKTLYALIRNDWAVQMDLWNVSKTNWRNYLFRLFFENADYTPLKYNADFYIFKQKNQETMDKLLLTQAEFESYELITPLSISGRKWFSTLADTHAEMFNFLFTLSSDTSIYSNSETHDELKGAMSLHTALTDDYFNYLIELVDNDFVLTAPSFAYAMNVKIFIDRLSKQARKLRNLLK